MEVHASIFGIGIGEMVIIAAIALVVIGPERFPEFARIVMRTIRDIRGYVDEAKQELDKELRPLKKEMRQLEQYQPKRYFDDITNKPKPAPAKPAGVGESTPESTSAADEPLSEASPIDPADTAPFQPVSEQEYDRSPTPFPAKDDRTASGDFEEEYRD